MDDVITREVFDRARKRIEENNIPPLTCSQCGGRFYGKIGGIKLTGWACFDSFESIPEKILCEHHKG